MHLHTEEDLLIEMRKRALISPDKHKTIITEMCLLPSNDNRLVAYRQLQSRRPVAVTALAHPVLSGSGAEARQEQLVKRHTLLSCLENKGTQPVFPFSILRNV
jgi:hypothetical protein